MAILSFFGAQVEIVSSVGIPRIIPGIPGHFRNFLAVEHAKEMPTHVRLLGVSRFREVGSSQRSAIGLQIKTVTDLW